MDAAAEKADKMIAEVRGGTAFNTAAQDYLDETSAESYSDPEYNHKTGDLGSTVTSTYREWLTDDSRQPGDLTSIEVENTGYCVVQFLGREKDTDSYQTMNYRSIQILAETTPSEDGSTALPTEDQLAAAKEQAQGLLDQWKAGDATADSFAALAKENSADETTKENGGLHEDANRDSLDAALTDWLFAQGRQVGDTTVVESTDSSGNVTGYQVLYVESFGEIQWKYQATSSLRSEDYNQWYEDLQAKYPAELTEDGKAIPTL